MTSPEPFTAAYDAIDRLKEAVKDLAAQREHYRLLADKASAERDTWRVRASAAEANAYIHGAS